jgi:hypothetical protein
MQKLVHHIKVLSTHEPKVDDIDELKRFIQQWSSAAIPELQDAIVNLTVLVDAIEEGVDIRELQEYKEIKRYALAGD